MNQSLTNTLALLGRVLMAWLFIPAGFSKIAGFNGAVGYAASAGLPMPEIGVAIGLLIELIGGVFLLIGFMTRPAAVLLALFTLVASFFFHAYWTLPADQASMQQLLFNKNIAVIGGLLGFAAFGAGALSVDAKRSRLAHNL
ncbi:DoxX family protein [Comamonas sp. NoAH]|uniref:DoxX family protein n=1 Tax=Comamonas halotolerans TaxID=3041496 RepID=UPI0024E0D34B|nr:DoxX family protein [Comamonas sp. NoAH]